MARKIHNLVTGVAARLPGFEPDRIPQQRQATAIHFVVPAVPVPQPRQRHRIAGTGDKAFVHNYTPTKHPVQAFKAAVQAAFSGVYSGPPIDGPVRLSLLFVLPRHKSLIWKKRPMPRAWHDHGREGDRDNFEKAVSDALKSLAWRDDRQVCAGPVLKVVAAGDEQPHAEVLIESLDGVNPPPSGLPAFRPGLEGLTQ